MPRESLQISRICSGSRLVVNDGVYEDNVPLAELGYSITRSIASNQNSRNPSSEETRPLCKTSEYSSRLSESLHDSFDVSDECSCSRKLIYGSVTLLSAWFPNVNPTNPIAKTWRTRLAKQGVVLWACFATISTICIINFVLAGLLWSRFDSSSDGVVTLYQGDCTIVGRADTATHLLINILSTLLMGASNLALQLIVAPTRKEVEKAHKDGTWLDIGIPSFHNLTRISRVSCAIWCCLALSSFPIHFLYNSAVFSSVSTNDVAWVVATKTFLTGPEWPAYTTNGTTLQGHTSMPDEASVNLIHNEYHNNPGLYINHTTYDCLKAYQTPYTWRPSRLIMMSSNSSSSKHLNSSAVLASGFHLQGPRAASQPLCLASVDMARKCNVLNTLDPQNLGQFVFYDDNLVIDYCLYKTADVMEATVHKCHLLGAPQILLVIACFGVIKFLCISWIIHRNNGPKLCILGDAIASFLEFPDPFTAHLGITSMETIQRSGRMWNTSHGKRSCWNPPRIPWRKAATARRWSFIIITSILFLAVAFSVVGMGLATQSHYQRSISMKSLWAMGFGVANPDEIITWHQSVYGRLGVFVNTCIANIWQVLMSLLYVIQNGLLSCMLVADEWSGFASERKTLRVSAPIGIQRSNYSLSMPMRYGIPMMTVFAIEHWLLSQSSFIVRASRTSWNGDSMPGWTTTGYSFIPSITAGLLYFCIVVTQLLISTRHYSVDPAMPLASTCSVAISAACHRPEADNEAHLLPVQWGVVSQDQHGLQHCAFSTSRYVQPPAKGSLVFGMAGTVKKRRNFLPLIFARDKNPRR